LKKKVSLRESCTRISPSERRESKCWAAMASILSQSHIECNAIPFATTSYPSVA
jgi:hypothetical protein